MAISETVIPISDVKLGIKSESTFGTLLDSDGTNTQAFRQLPVVQATKPTFILQGNQDYYQVEEQLKMQQILL